MSKRSSFESIEGIGFRTYDVRDKKVLLDADVAVLFHLETRRLNEMVRRNIGYFSDESVFRVDIHEFKMMMSQYTNNENDTTDSKPYYNAQKNLATSISRGTNVRSARANHLRINRIHANLIGYHSNISEKGSGGRRRPPNVFTEKGFDQFSKLYKKRSNVRPYDD